MKSSDGNITQGTSRAVPEFQSARIRDPRNTEPSSSTWAKVAAFPIETNEVTDPIPSFRTPTSLTDDTKETLDKVTPPKRKNPNIHEAVEKQFRVVHIRGLSKETKLRDVTAHINEGPIVSIFFYHDHKFPLLSARIIFMEANSARAIVQRARKEKEESGHTVFGAGTEVVKGGRGPKMMRFAQWC